MKSKILLMLIISSMGLAAYVFFNSLNKAKNEVYYSVAGENIQSNSTLFIKNGLKIPKKKTAKRSSTRNQTGSSSEAMFQTNRLMLDNSLTTNVSGVISSTTAKSPISRRNEISSVNSDLSGMMIAQSVGTKGRISSENTTSGGNMYYNSPENGSQLNSLQKATNDNNDIIIDPGSDPDPGSQIPVGEGVYILFAMLVVYLVYAIHRKK
ncbi:MAG: hypothetical protein QM751_01540 [Paludibacteraceae bacterium]